MSEFLELYELRRFLPLPYEAAAAPRLKLAQGKLQEERPPWVGLPGEGAALLRLHTLAESILTQGRTLLAVEDGALRSGIEGVAGCLGAKSGQVWLLGGLPGEEELRQALELAEYQDVILYTAGGEHTPAFRRIRAVLAERYGGEAGRHVLLAEDLGPGGSGGFGLLTAAGLLPMAVLGVDLGALLCGAVRMMERCKAASYENPAWRYAAARRQLCRSGFTVELLCGWDPALRPLLEWAKGLFAAAEGKERRTLFPVVVDYSRDFRSLGQCLQDGPRLFFETSVRLDAAGSEDSGLSGIREAVLEGTLLSHTEHGVPNLVLRPGGADAASLGGLIYFFQYACGLSACLLDADPAACPGVEACEERIRSLLPPGGEERGERAERQRPVPAGIL